MILSIAAGGIRMPNLAVRQEAMRVCVPVIKNSFKARKESAGKVVSGLLGSRE